MADASFAQTSFLGGEWSLRMQGRFDRPDYRTALNVCLNAFPTETGPWTRRPGFQFGGTTRSGGPGRLFSFNFQAAAPYEVEFTNGHMRFWNGPNLVTTNDGVVVTSISTANPAVATLASAVTWSSSDQVYFTLLGASCPLLQNRVFTLGKVDTTHFALADAITGLGIDGATLGVGALAAGATINRVLEISTSFAGTSWSLLRATQVLSVTNSGAQVQAVFLHPSFPPTVISVLTVPAPGHFATFNYAGAPIADGPYLDPVTTGETLVLSGAGVGVGGIVTVTASGSNFGGFNATDVGRLIRVFFEPPVFNIATTYTSGNVVSYPSATTSTAATTYWTFFGAAPAAGIIPTSDPTKWAPTPANINIVAWKSLAITAYTSPTVVTGSIDGFPLFNSSGASGASPTLAIPLWRLGAYSATTGYPTCATFHEGRLWLAGAIGNRIDASVSNDSFNFAPTNIIGTVAANSAISYTFNAPDVNPIYWLMPDLQGIIAGTKAGEWLVQSPTTGPISPTNIAARRITKIKGANIEPVRTEHTVLFVQAFGRKIMEYFADIYSGKFSGPHASFTWKHLLALGCDEIAYQQERIPILWMRVKGALVSAVYKRDTLTTAQGPTISAGARHTLGSGRTVESISVGSSIGGDLDSLSMVTNDPATGIRHVEIMTDVLEEGSSAASAWYLDDAVRPSSTTTTRVPTPVTAPYGGMTLNGLWHLNGKTVQVYAGGVDCGNVGDNTLTFTDFVVTNGSVFVPYGDGVSAGSGAGLFTPAFAAAAAAAGTIVVGFTYNSDGQIVRPATPQESGARTGPALAKPRRVDEFGLEVEGTAGLAIGTTFANLKPVLFKDAAGTTLAPNVTFSGIVRDSLDDDYGYDGMVCWRIARPYPANVIALAGFLQTQDS